MFLQGLTCPHFNSKPFCLFRFACESTMGCTSSQNDVAESGSNPTNRTSSTPHSRNRSHSRTNSEIEFEKKRNEEMAGNGGADALMVI
jgi:hypothetical protein